MRQKEFCKVERRCHAYPQGVIEFLIGAFGNSFHQGQGIVDEIVHFSMLRDYLLRKADKGFFLRQIADKIAVGPLVDHEDGRAVFPEFLGNTFSNALCTASDDRYFILKHVISLLLFSVYHEILEKAIEIIKFWC